MKQLLFALLAAQLIVCAEYSLLRDMTLNTTSKPIVMTFNREDWNNITEFAISGWIRVDKWVNSQISLFRFISNVNATADGRNAEKKVLKAVLQDNSVTFSTYDQRNSDPDVEHPRLSFSNSDFGQWIFIYQGYKADYKRTYAQVITPTVNIGNSCTSHIDHLRSNVYQLIFGENSPIYQNIIDIAGINISYGNGAYLESGLDSKAKMQNTILPSVSMVNQKECITTYDQCNYKGNSQVECNTALNINNINFKSVYIPHGSQVNYKINNQTNSTYTFSESQSCITSVNIDDLLKYGQVKLQNTTRLLRAC